MKSNLMSTIGIIICLFIGSALAAPPQLTLVKEVVGGEAAVTDWILTADGTDANDLSGPGFISGFVDPDTFLLSESAGQPGYTAGAWDCTGGGILDGQSLTLSVDEVVTCTIINTHALPVVVFDTGFALPAMPDGPGPGAPVCVDDSGLLVAGCDSVQARIFGTCPVGEFVVGVNSDGSVQCASVLNDCSPDLVCPIPASGTSCISGWLSDIKTGSPLRADTATTQSCNSGAEGGPCDLVIEIFDAVSFASNPAGTPLLPFSEFLVDGCGRFRFTDITPPALGLVALTVADKVKDYELSAKFMPLSANETVEQVNALAAETSTVQMWTDSAGSPFGSETFADRGVLFATFSKDGVPVSGVKLTRNDVPVPADDYYFSDGYSSVRTTINASLDSTGINGAALMINSDLVTHSGEGGESDGCFWSDELVDAIAGVVTVAEFTCN